MNTAIKKKKVDVSGLAERKPEGKKGIIIDITPILRKKRESEEEIPKISIYKDSLEIFSMALPFIIVAISLYILYKIVN